MSPLATLLKRVDALSPGSGALAVATLTPAADTAPASLAAEPVRDYHSLLSLVASRPFAGDLVDRLLDERAIALDQVGASILSWDLLRHVILDDADPRRLALRRRLDSLEGLLTADTTLLSLLSSERLYQLVWRNLVASDSEDALSAAKAHAATEGQLSPDLARLLLDAVLQRGDIEAMIALEHCDGWPDDAAESLAAACGQILALADAAAAGGYSGYATYLLSLLDEVEDDDEGDAVLGSLLLDHGYSDAARRIIDRIDLTNPALSPDVRFAPPIRLALAEGRAHDALLLSEPYRAPSDPAALARRAPLLTVAVVETCLQHDLDTPLLGELPGILQRDPLCCEAATVLADTKFLALWVKGAGERAVDVFTEPLLHYPGHMPLWQRFHERAGFHELSADAVAAVLLRIVERHGHAIPVWEAIACCPALDSAVREKITARLGVIRRRQLA